MGKFESAIIEAQKLLKGDLPPLDIASCLCTIGFSKSKIGESSNAIPYLLEALSTFPNSETLLIGHVQDELARIQFQLKFYKSALFFTEMAINNFELGGNAEMKESCEALREEILWNL